MEKMLSGLRPGNETPKETEFTIVRDVRSKSTKILLGKAPVTSKSFEHADGVKYHYSNDLSQFSEQELDAMPTLSKELLASEGVSNKLRKVLDVCAKNPKELLHTEDIVLSDFTIGDRAEAHLLPRPHVNCHSLVTCEVNGVTQVVFILEGTSENPIIWPFTTGGHLAVTDEVRTAIENRPNVSETEFRQKMFAIIRANMSKEIGEETGIEIDPSSITYFQADPEDPNKTHLRFRENFSKVTKGNEEDIHIFHAHVSENQLKTIVADKNDGVEGHVITPLEWVEKILGEGGRIPLFTLDGRPFSIRKREEFSSDEEFEQLGHFANRSDLNQEFVTVEPEYIPKFVGLVRENLRLRK